MKCDHCDKPAVVHEVVIKDGQKTEVHLCEAHASAAGYVPQPQPLNQLLSSISPANQIVRKSGASPACPACGMTLAQFRQHGNLGCETCYETFEGVLESLIERAHAGGTHHIGRSPSGAARATELRELRMKLVRELDEAVAAEQYERAARLRDRLHGLGERDEGEADGSASPDQAPGQVNE
jgi:protein arginine kinase activator